MRQPQPECVHIQQIILDGGYQLHDIYNMNETSTSESTVQITRIVFVYYHCAQVCKSTSTVGSDLKSCRQVHGEVCEGFSKVIDQYPKKMPRAYNLLG